MLTSLTRNVNYSYINLILDTTEGLSFVEQLRVRNSKLRDNARNNELVPLLPNVNICERSTDSNTVDNDILMNDVFVKKDITPCLNEGE